MSGSFAGLLASIKTASVALAGGLMVRLSVAGANLAGGDISNLVMNAGYAYFRSCDTQGYTGNGYLTKVNFNIATPTAIANKYTASSTSYANYWFKSSIFFPGASENTAYSLSTSGSVGSYTVTVSSSTNLKIWNSVSGTGIQADTYIVSINGTSIGLNKPLTSTILNVLIDYSPFGNSIQGLFMYNYINSGGGPSFVYTTNNSGLVTTVRKLYGRNSYIPFIASKCVRNTDGSFWFGGYDDTNNPYFSYLPQIGLHGFKGSGDGDVALFENSSGIWEFCDLTNDSTNNAIVLSKKEGSSQQRIVLTKLSYTVPITKLWSKDFTIDGVNLRLTKPTLMTYNDNHYIVGQRTNYGEVILIKVGNDGVIGWSKRLTGLPTYDGDFSIVATGNTGSIEIYFAYNTGGGIGIMKFIDAGSGAILSWQNIFMPTTGSIPTVPIQSNTQNQNSNVSISLDSGFLYVLSRYAFNTGTGVEEPFILKLPTNGTISAGNIVLSGKIFTYSRSTYTEITPNISNTNSAASVLTNYGAYGLTEAIGTVTTPAITSDSSAF
jgi:hypothetical protein